MAVGDRKLERCAEFFLHNMAEHTGSGFVDEGDTRVVQVRRRPDVEVFIFGRGVLQLCEFLRNRVDVVFEDLEVETPLAFGCGKLVGQLILKLDNGFWSCFVD